MEDFAKHVRSVLDKTSQSLSILVFGIAASGKTTFCDHATGLLQARHMDAHNVKIGQAIRNMSPNVELGQDNPKRFNQLVFQIIKTVVVDSPTQFVYLIDGVPRDKEQLAYVTLMSERYGNPYMLVFINSTIDRAKRMAHNDLTRSRISKKTCGEYEFLYNYITMSIKGGSLKNCAGVYKVTPLPENEYYITRKKP